MKRQTYAYIKDNEIEYRRYASDAAKYVDDLIQQLCESNPDFLNHITQEVRDKMVRFQFYTTLLSMGLMVVPRTCQECPFYNVSIAIRTGQVMYTCMNSSGWYDVDFAYGESGHQRPIWCKFN